MAEPETAKRPRQLQLDLAILRQIGAVPVAATEYQQISYYLPLAVEIGANFAPRLVAVVAPNLLSYSILSSDGKWRPKYMPLAIRLLHFGVGLGAHPMSAVQFDQRGRDQPLPDAPADAMALFRELATSSHSLSVALDQLQLARLLQPLAQGLPLQTIRNADLDALDHATATALGRTNFAPWDIAGSIVMSRRRLAPALRSAEDETDNPVIDGNAQPKRSHEDPKLGLIAPDLMLDDGETFGYEPD